MKQFNQFRHRKSKQRGSTIIEAMVAVFVLSIGALVLMLAQLGSVSSVLDANNQSEVARAADNYAEELAATPNLRVKESGPAGKKKIHLTQDYSSEPTDCKSKLESTTKLSNTKIDSCAVDATGKITIKWGAQDAKDTDGFTYTLSAGNTAP